MRIEYLHLVVPILYAGIQYAAIVRMEGEWRNAAFLPAGIMMIAFTFQVMLGLADAGFAMLFPLTGMILSTVYLAGLHWLYGRERRDAAGRACRRPADVFAIKDFR